MARIAEEFPELSDGYICDCEIDQAAKIGDLAELSYQTIHVTLDRNYTLSYPLSLAAGRGHLDVVQFLVQKFDVSDDDDAIGAAAAHGHLEVVQYLVEKGPSWIDGKHSNGTPLSFASKYGWLEVAEYLITKGAEIDANDNQALRWACETGQLEIIECLHRNGANIHDVEVLEEACRNGQLDVVVYLDQNGVDIERGPDCCSDAYCYAVNLEHPEIVAYFENREIPPPPVPDKDRDNKICPISLCEMDASTAKLVCSKCKNVFSKDALDKWLEVSNKCPFRCSGAKFYNR